MPPTEATFIVALAAALAVVIARVVFALRSTLKAPPAQRRLATNDLLWSIIPLVLLLGLSLLVLDGHA